MVSWKIIANERINDTLGKHFNSYCNSCGEIEIVRYNNNDFQNIEIVCPMCNGFVILDPEKALSIYNARINLYMMVIFAILNQIEPIEMSGYFITEQNRIQTTLFPPVQSVNIRTKFSMDMPGWRATMMFFDIISNPIPEPIIGFRIDDKEESIKMVLEYLILIDNDLITVDNIKNGLVTTVLQKTTDGGPGIRKRLENLNSNVKDSIIKGKEDLVQLIPIPDEIKTDQSVTT